MMFENLNRKFKEKLMKTELYYFSGTGNSLAVAKDLAAQLSSEENQVEIIPIANLVGSDSIKIKAETAGFIFPVYCHDIPPIIEEFLNKLQIEDQYLFSIATHNGEVGNSFFNMYEILKKKGTHLSEGSQLTMPGNSVIVFDLTSTDEENEIRFNEVNKRIPQIASIITKQKEVGIEGEYNPDEKYEAKFFLKDQYNVPQHFWTTDDCTACGTCEKVCPRNNVSLIEEKVTWQENCENCLACLHWCPEKALQIGEISVKTRRYHHPGIKVKEIMLQTGTGVPN